MGLKKENEKDSFFCREHTKTGTNFDFQRAKKRRRLEKRFGKCCDSNVLSRNDK